MLTLESAPRTTPPSYATATTVVPVWGGTCRFHPHPPSIELRDIYGQDHKRGASGWRSGWYTIEFGRSLSRINAILLYRVSASFRNCTSGTFEEFATEMTDIGFGSNLQQGLQLANEGGGIPDILRCRLPCVCKPLGICDDDNFGRRVNRKPFKSYQSIVAYQWPWVRFRVVT